MDAGQIVGLVTGPGAALALFVVLGYMWLKGKIHSDREFAEACRQRDEWKGLWEKEADAHKLTRDALAVANDRQEAAVEAARVSKQLLEAVQSEQRSRARKPREV